MTPIFDSNAALVGWFDGHNIFDADLRWIAFSVSGQVFSAESLAWLGPLNGTSFLDRNGKPVGWLEGSTPKGAPPSPVPLTPLRPLAPLRPNRPVQPITPIRPLVPLGGWSPQRWESWWSAQE